MLTTKTYHSSSLDTCIEAKKLQFSFVYVTYINRIDTLITEKFEKQDKNLNSPILYCCHARVT